MTDVRSLTPKGRRTRERIVETAAELVARDGVATVTLDDVKAAAQVGNSQLYHYFRDRAELLQAVIVHLSDTVIARQEPLVREMESLGALRAWRSLVVEVQHTLGPEGGCPIGSLGSEVAESDAAARVAVSRSMQRWEGALRAGLSGLRERGALREDADPEQLALSLMAALQGGLLLGKIHRSTRPLEGALDAAIAHVESFASTSVSAPVSPAPGTAA